jgi:broad specificity phosphatase PhoE
MIVRHAEAAGTDGHDPPLTARGRDQAHRLAARLTAARADRLSSSTLRRASETAEIISEAVQLPILLDPRLREVGTCWPDGTPTTDGWPKPGDFVPRELPDARVREGGESWGHFRRRIRLAVDDLLDTRDTAAMTTTIIVVCHGGVLDALFESITSAVSPCPLELALAHTGLSHLEFRPGQRVSPWIWHRHNDVTHLVAAAGIER